MQRFKGQSKDKSPTLLNIREEMPPLFTFLCPSRGFKELDSQVLYGEYGGVSLLLPLLVLFPQALHTARTQALRL